MAALMAFRWIELSRGLPKRSRDPQFPFLVTVTNQHSHRFPSVLGWLRFHRETDG